MPSRNDKSDMLPRVESLKQRINQLEEMLAEYEERFRTLTVFSPVGIFLDNPEGKAIYINNKCAELVGVPAEEALDLDWVPFIHPEDRERVTTEWIKAFKNSNEFHQEYRWVHPDGKVVWTLGDIVPVRGENGRTSLFIGTLTDITDRKQAEEEREQLRTQLIQAQKMESIGRLAGGVAHDFNNMLGVILGQAELALANIDPSSKLHDNVQEILNAAERSRDITRQLLAFARKQIIAPEVLDLNEIVTKMLNTLKHLMGEDIDIVWLPGINIWPVKMDPSQVDQILANLCVNARDAIAGIGRIIVETSNVIFDEAYCADHSGFKPGEFVLLSMTDDGCGMDNETRDHIFEPFFTTKGLNEGTGLGLAMVYGSIKQNNGFINVYSEPGQGTVFKLYLPRQEGKTEKIKTEDTTGSFVGHGETVLLVEDEEQLMEMLETMLEGLGYQVLSTQNPNEALRIAEDRSGEIHLIIADVVLPEMNGPDLANIIHNLYPDVKTLFMSGYTSNVISHRGILEQGVNFIQKPFSQKNLGIKIREVLEQK